MDEKVLSVEEAYRIIKEAFPDNSTESIFDWGHSYGFSPGPGGGFSSEYYLINKKSGEIRDLSDFSEYIEALKELGNNSDLPHDSDGGAIIKAYKVKDYD